MRRIVQIELSETGEFKLNAQNVTMVDLFGMLNTAKQYAEQLYRPRIIEAVANWKVTDAV